MADAKWASALGRQATVDDVLRYVLDHWAQLQRRPPPALAFSNKEPKITKFFGFSLQKNALSHGITGYFIPEAPVADINAAQELEKLGRTDLLYVSDQLDPRLELVFEFKKLKLKSADSRRDYCTEGVRRFVDGIYGRGQDLGFMIGLIERHAEEAQISAALRRAMQVPDLSTIMRFILDDQGRKIGAPAKRQPLCSFETMHARDHVEGCSDLVIGHLSLACEAPLSAG